MDTHCTDGRFFFISSSAVFASIPFAYMRYAAAIVVLLPAGCV
jgi:hypothetical protein